MPAVLCSRKGDQTKKHGVDIFLAGILCMGRARLYFPDAADRCCQLYSRSHYRKISGQGGRYCCDCCGCCIRPSYAWHIQVQRLYRRKYQRPFFMLYTRSRYKASYRYQLLYLPDHILYNRLSLGKGQAAEKLQELPAVPYAVPTACGRPHCKIQHHRKGDREPHR